MKKAIVLLSGGIDSATTLYYAKARGYRCECLTFDYGQKNKREVSSARRIAATCGLRLTVVKFRLRWGGSSLLRGNLGIPRGTKPKRGKIPSTYVPGRNTIFLSFALSYAEAHKAGAIFIGAHTQDYSGYPDCRSRYFKAFGKMVHLGTKAGITGKKIKITVWETETSAASYQA